MIPVNPDDVVAVVPDVVQSWTVGSVLVVLAFVVAGLIMLLYIRKVFKPFLDSLRNFMDDWNGEPARPGRDKRSGVMERLERLEDGMTAVGYQLRANGGSSMYDAVKRIDMKVHDDSTEEVSSE